MCRLFPCIPIFRSVFLLKSVKKMCMCVGVKNRIITQKNVCFGVKKSVSEFWR